MKPSSCFLTKLRSIVTFFSLLSLASKLISSSKFSKIVCNLLAPISSISILKLAACVAISSIESVVNSNSIFSVAIKAIYCFIKLDSGSVRIFI